MIENCIRPAPDCFWCPFPRPLSGSGTGAHGRQGWARCLGAKGASRHLRWLLPGEAELKELQTQAGWRGTHLAKISRRASSHREPIVTGGAGLAVSPREQGQAPFLLSSPLDRAASGWPGVLRVPWGTAPAPAKGCGARIPDLPTSGQPSQLPCRNLPGPSCLVPGSQC